MSDKELKNTKFQEAFVSAVVENNLPIEAGIVFINGFTSALKIVEDISRMSVEEGIQELNNVKIDLLVTLSTLKEIVDKQEKERKESKEEVKPHQLAVDPSGMVH